MIALLPLLLQAAPLAPAAPKDPIPVLVISGANNHDWEWTTPSLARILGESGRFAVEVTYAPAETLADSEKARSFAAFVVDYNGPGWGEAAQENFMAAVRAGAGVVAVHAANNNGRDWPEYERLVGDLWRDGTGHGRFHTFDVGVVDRDHPVTRTLPTMLSHPDELYHRLVHVEGVERRALMTAFSDPETGGTGEYEPMVLVGLHGEGRVFHTTLGHVWRGNIPSQASHRDPQFRGLIVRGTEWVATGTVRDEESAHAPLTEAERALGWRSLADRALWRAFGGDDVPEGWSFEGDVIRRSAAAGDIVTKELFGDFELTFQWKTTIASNSGLKYRIPADATQPIGPEYQLLDEHAGEKSLKHRAGAIYDVVAAEPVPSIPWGEFHTARIVARGTRIEHWLDGVLVASAEVGSDAWNAALAESKFKGRADFATAQPGRILLQDHGDEVIVRALRIRSLGAPETESESGGEPLFSAAPLAENWTNVGDALYAIEDGVLVGRAGPARKQSFLVSKESFGDFELEVDLRIAVSGNSGIQFRSHVEGGRLHGYQAEIDPTDRSWSGGIYDEGRRGWLDDLADEPEARAAFRRDGWNRYRIVCEGPHLRTWVNGVPAADLLDGADLTGKLGFQVHGGDDDIEIHWKNARVVRRGAHAWRAVEGVTDGSKRCALEGAPGLRVRALGPRTEVRVTFADGTTETVDPRADKHWHAGGHNLLCLLRTTGDADAKAVLQLNDTTIARWTKAPEMLAIEGATSIVEWERCGR